MKNLEQTTGLLGAMPPSETSQWTSIDFMGETSKIFKQKQSEFLSKNY